MIKRDPETKGIWVNIFYINKNSRRCVPSISCHPKYCKTNILFTFARRIIDEDTVTLMKTAILGK